MFEDILNDFVHSARMVLLWMRQAKQVDIRPSPSPAFVEQADQSCRPIWIGMGASITIDDNQPIALGEFDSNRVALADLKNLNVTKGFALA